MKILKCRLCGKTSTHKKFDVSYGEGKEVFPVYECAECRFQFRDIPEKTAYSFYGENYYKGKASFSYLDERKNEEASRVVWKARMKRLAKNDDSGVPADKKAFLDVGCSFGGLMQVAKESGYDPFGAEVSNYSGAYAKKRFGGKKVFIGSIEKIRLPRERFSAITMIEVIEHLFRPGTALKRLYGSMKKGGVLLVQTADMAGLQAKIAGKNYHYYLPGHLSYFNRTNLGAALKKAGFKKVKFIDGVEFGLLPKLIKSRAGFKKASDYLSWARITFYHILSKIRMTSSMVVLAWKS